MVTSHMDHIGKRFVAPCLPVTMLENLVWLMCPQLDAVTAEAGPAVASRALACLHDLTLLF
jgi:hypothetical protein